ncbi:MAG: hypothetical protein Q6367_013975 [Candidatus Freyarchaeota archaeon]
MTIDLNHPPQAINLETTQGDYCVIRSAHVFLSWEFSGQDEGDYQTAKQIQIATDLNFNSIVFESGKISSQSQSYSQTSLSYNQTYYWRVKVWDSKDAESGWVTGPSFSPPKHLYPDVSFVFSPRKPLMEEIIQFNDNSTCFDEDLTLGQECSVEKNDSFSWFFTGGNPETSFLENSTTTFAGGGKKVLD